jgi:hypothetical protein
MPARILTSEERDYIASNYADTRSDKIAEYLNCSIHSVYRIAAKMGIKKSIEFMQSENSERLNKLRAEKNQATRFKKGHVSVNKGTKMSDELKQKYAHTFFKKGHVPVNTLYDGAIRTRNDKNGYIYKLIRIAKAKWIMLQVYNWEKKYGQIPKGKILVSQDGDTLNCDPDNWLLIDKATNLDRNSGRSALTDKYVITKLSPRDRKMREVIAKSPELINLKRNQLKLRRQINERI